MRATKAVRWGLLVLGLIASASLVGCASATKSAALDSQQLAARKAEIKELGETGDMTVYEDLVAVLREHPERLLRSEAAFSLGKLGQRYYSVGFYPLVDSLENDPSTFVRSAAALSLSYTRDSRAIAPLVRALKDTARAEMAIRQEDKVVVYKACVSDAARASLERIVGISFASNAEGVEGKRVEIAGMWGDWYAPREHVLPSETALASR